MKNMSVVGKRILLFWIFFIFMCQTSACDNTSSGSSNVSGEKTAETVPVRVVESYPHDRGAFTQGLVYHDGILYESTGLYGKSSVRILDWKTGEILRMTNMPADFFGEGITLFGGRLIQLTWKSEKVFFYAPRNLEVLGEFDYFTEGWGITHDGKRLITSDGSSRLYFLDPESFDIVKTVEVLDGNRPVSKLNELEFVNGYVYANVWQKEIIAVISPETGQVVRKIDCSGLLNFSDLSQPVDVLNGIAFLPEENRLLITGKLWPKMFEIELE